jgi:type I restriction enzyme M protein
MMAADPSRADADSSFAIDQVFQRMLETPDPGRSPERVALALALLALKFLTDTYATLHARGGAVDAVGSYDREIGWHHLQLHPYASADVVRALAGRVEAELEWAHGLFTGILLRHADDLADSTLRSWINLVAAVPLDGASGHAPVPFVAWFERQLDEGTLDVRFAEFGTPRSVARLMVTLAEIEPGARILDPATGTGAVLAEGMACGAVSGSAPPVIQLFGQEPNRTAWAWAKLRVFLLGHPDLELACQDSLREPAFTRDGQLARFDRVLSHGPFAISLDRDFAHCDPYRRFPYGLPPRYSSEAAFIQHAISSLVDGGRAVVLIPHGFLFRGGVDARVRRALVERGLIHAVVGLPAGTLLPYTGVQPAILVLRQHSASDTPVVVVNVSPTASKGRGPVILDNETIEQIHGGVRRPSATSGVGVRSRFVSMREIAEQKWSLQPGRYVTGEDAPNAMDLAEVRRSVDIAEASYRDATSEIEELLRRLR